MQNHFSLGIDSAKTKKCRYKNYVSKINTDSYVVVSSYKDGSDALKNELSLSFQRIIATKNGHNLGTSLKSLRSEFYTPN